MRNAPPPPARSSGVNVLNPLHAWPNKPSYELRLAKYASRGYAVSVPGIEKKQVKLEHLMQDKVKLRDLKGLARFLKVAAVMDSSTLYQTKEYAEERIFGQPSVLRWQVQRPKVPKEVPALRRDEANATTADELLLESLNEGYDDVNNIRASVVVPNVHLNPSRPTYWELHNFQVHYTSSILTGGTNAESSDGN